VFWLFDIGICQGVGEIMTLYDEMHQLYKQNENDWNYYERAMINPFEDSFLVKDFIKEYFNYGGKSMVVEELINEMEPMRHSHTVSTFFLGQLLKQKICPNLEILSLQNDNNFKFSYLWFIVCLFHDMGYIQENDWMYKYKYRNDSKEYLRQYSKLIKNKFPRRFEYEDLGIIFCSPIKFRGALRNREHFRNEQGIIFSNGISIQKARYTQNTILNYLEYCKMNEKIKHYDHGIVGGLWLYDSLIKNYYKHYFTEMKNNNALLFDSFVNSENLHFSTEQWKIFAYLADCIISHNMWPATNQTNYLYNICGLEQLTMENYTCISFQEDPILYLLALSDTLEPIKTYSGLGLTDIEIWKGISVQINSDKIVMKIDNPRMPFERLNRKVEGIEHWIDCRVEIDKSIKELKIYFSSQII